MVTRSPADAGGFEDAVTSVLLALRPGEVVTYGEVAEEAGHPGAARAVGNILARSEGLPWWRVVSSTGRLVPGHEAEHAQRLGAEGVRISRGKAARQQRAGRYQRYRGRPGQRNSATRPAARSAQPDSTSR